MTFSFQDLPPPEFTQEPAFEPLLQQIVADFRARAPEWDHLTSADPALKLLESQAAQEVLDTRRLNAAVRALLLGSSTGADLDWLVARDGVLRKTGETDEELRQRDILVRRSSSTAGTPVRYGALARAADPRLQDIHIASGDDGTVHVVILSRELEYLAQTTDIGAEATYYGLQRDDVETDEQLRLRIERLINAAGPIGTATGTLLAVVEEALSGSQVRALGDVVSVWTAVIQTVDVVATVWFDPDATEVPRLSALEAAFRADWGPAQLGRQVARSWIVSRLHAAGISRVDLALPTADLYADERGALILRNVELTQGGLT